MDEFNKLKNYILLNSLEAGDCIMISKYVGTDFHDNKGGGSLTLVREVDLIGLVVDD